MCQQHKVSEHPLKVVRVATMMMAFFMVAITLKGRITGEPVLDVLFAILMGWLLSIVMLLLLFRLAPRWIDDL